MKKVIYYVVIVINVLYVALIVFLFMNEKVDQGIISLIFIVFPILIDLTAFMYYFKQYPRNNLLYKFDYKPKTSKLGITNKKNHFEIKVARVENKWKVLDCDEGIEFNLHGLLFQKKYIASYFIRNFHFEEMNHKKYDLNKLFKNLRLEYLKRYSSVKIIYIDKNKTTELIIVNNNKTKNYFICRLFMLSKYYRHLYHRYSYSNSLYRHSGLSEEKFLNGKL